MQEGFKRKLTAILSADVEGYSRLMRDNEEATIQRLTSYRTAMTRMIQHHKGRVVDATGDNLLAEFGSVADSVDCAVEIQRELAERNADLPEDRRMRFRIGINLGDVFEKDGRIYGDGVNIAARMESLAEAGGICISGTVYDSIQTKLGLEYEYLGEQTVKNITDPIRSYRVLSYPGAAAHQVVKTKRAVQKKWRNTAMAISAILFMGVGAVAIWNFFLRPSPSAVETASIEKMAFPLPDHPSIAVLPFVNMSDDPNQDYFSDGLTEDLITDLSKISGLFVISRNSSFSFKGKTVKIRKIAEELGVRYVLEGSVRKARNRVRINAQLIDATVGHHLWAERYDGNLDDIFDLQDKINQKIVSALAVKLTMSEKSQLARKETENIEVYDNFLKGLEHYRRNTPDDWAKAVSYLETAVRIEPNYGRAYALLARIYDQIYADYFGYYSGPPPALRVSYNEAQELAKKYLQMAMNNPTSHYYWLASKMSLHNRKYQLALAEAKKGLALDPNNPDILVQLANVLVFTARPDDAIEYINKARRIDPYYDDSEILYVTGMAYFTMENFEDALTLFEKAHKKNPEERWYTISLASTYAHLGREQEAQDTIFKAREGLYDLAIATVMAYMPFRDPEIANLYAEGLRKAGLK